MSLLKRFLEEVMNAALGGIDLAVESDGEHRARERERPSRGRKQGDRSRNADAPKRPSG